LEEKRLGSRSEESSKRRRKAPSNFNLPLCKIKAGQLLRRKRGKRTFRWGGKGEQGGFLVQKQGNPPHRPRGILERARKKNYAEKGDLDRKWRKKRIGGRNFSTKKKVQEWEGSRLRARPALQIREEKRRASSGGKGSQVGRKIW